MYTLIIGNSKSKNFSKALECALTLGGSYNGKEIKLETNEEMSAYTKWFPLFKYNVLDWKGTRAYFNGKEVDTYRFMFLADLKRKSNVRSVFDSLDLQPSDIKFKYYKREGNRFFLKSKNEFIDLVLEGKDLYDFVDKYSIDDYIKL